MEEKTIDQLWTEVTGLTWSVEALIKSFSKLSTEEKDAKMKELAWNIPDGAMLDGECYKREVTAELLTKLGIDLSEKFSELDYDSEETGDDTGSSE